MHFHNLFENDIADGQLRMKVIFYLPLACRITAE